MLGHHHVKTVLRHPRLHEESSGNLKRVVIDLYLCALLQC